MQYPGHIVKLGEPDSRIVKALKAQLNRMLAVQRIAALKLKLDDPNFGPKMKQAVQLFQARSVDGDGHPLKPDGEVGSITWACLFGPETVVTSDTAADSFLAKVLVQRPTAPAVVCRLSKTLEIQPDLNPTMTCRNIINRSGIEVLNSCFLRVARRRAISLTLKTLGTPS